jgi:1A family penicillin-binding protein
MLPRAWFDRCLAALDPYLEALRPRLEALKPRFEALKPRLEALRPHVEALRPHIDRLKHWVVLHRRALGGVAASLLLACIILIAVIFAGLPGREQLRLLGEMPQATTLYDVHNRPVFTIFREYRIEVPLSQVSPHLRRAIVAFEDQRFEDHQGIDLVRILGAAWADLREGRAAQGGSTLTQQLARQSFLTREKKLWRKLREIALAIRIESIYTKDEILELYLNKVYFGDGLYGAEAAARGYFGKSATDLDLAESALLAGLVNAPSVNAPTVNVSRALGRRALVLRSMHEQGVIAPEEYQGALKSKVALRDVLRREEPHGQHFKEEVRQQLVKQFGWERLSEGGLRVYTTIDPEMQRAAEAVVAESVQEIEARRAKRYANRKNAAPEVERLEAALVALDPTTGEVRAMVGGRDFKTSRFNRATQALRQPGSAFKPFVYAAALEAGYAPSSVVTALDQPVQTFQGAWLPEDEHSDASEMTVRAALRTSSNRAAVRMLEEIGITTTVDQAKKMGLGNLPAVPSVALGSGEVTLMAMTSAYAAFSDGGRLRPATFIRRIEGANGEVLYQVKPSETQVVTPRTAFMMTSMLSDVINYGTAYKARQDGFVLPAAGKTGTTNDYVDAWFLGFTPKLVTGVWVGFDKPKTIISGGFAGELAVPMWARFMKKATAADKPEAFKMPDGLTSANVCRVTGKLPGAFCDRVVTDYFARGTVPSEICQGHNFQLVESQVVAVATAGSAVDHLREVSHPELAVAGAVPAPGASAVAVASESPESPKKKRGFWGRIFGRGDDDRDRDRDNKEKKEVKKSND